MRHIRLLHIILLESATHIYGTFYYSVNGLHFDGVGFLGLLKGQDIGPKYW
jgi:hypothetical protein